MNPIKSIACAIALALTAYATAEPVPASFTYQGTLHVDGQPVQTDADFVVRLHDGPSLIAALNVPAVSVNNGLFELDLNFGPTLFDGTAYELEILVRSPAGVGAYEALTPRQPLQTTPYAFHANTADTLITPAVLEGNTDSDLLTLNQNDDLHDTVALRAARGLATRAELGIPRVVEIDSDDTPVGLFSFAHQFPVVGHLGADTANFNSAAVLGEIDFAGPGGQFALWGLNLSSGNQARLGTDDYAADLDGDLRVDGEITRQFAPNSFDIATPIAYGYIYSDGSIANGTPNFSCTWNAASNRYEILIDDESYFFNEYVTTVTPGSSNLAIRTSSAGGRLLVYFNRTTDQQSAQAGFQFTTYKTSGAAEVQGRQRPQLAPLSATNMDEDLYPRLAPSAPRVPIVIEPTTKSPTQPN